MTRQFTKAHSPIAEISPLSLVYLGANRIFGARDGIIWQPFVVEAVAVPVRCLFVVGAVAFEGAFVAIGIAWRRVVFS